MDGLSAAASGMAVVSLAMQVADGLWKLHKFFESVQEAPAEIQGISAELDVLAHIVHRLVPNENVYRDVLESVKSKVQNLQEIVAKLEPGLKSDRRLVRRWTALKSVAATGRIRHFRDSLEETKSSLMLGLQATTLALQHTHSQQLAQTGNTNTIDARYYLFDPRLSCFLFHTDAAAGPSPPSSWNPCETSCRCMWPTRQALATPSRATRRKLS